MSPIGPAKDHTAIEIPPEHVAIPIPVEHPEEVPQAGLGARIAFLGAKALQTAGAVYTAFCAIGSKTDPRGVDWTDWTKSIIQLATIGALKPWLYYGKGIETEIEKKWAVIEQGNAAAAGAVLKDEMGKTVSVGAWLGASSLVGKVSRWFWGPTYLNFSHPKISCQSYCLNPDDLNGLKFSSPESCTVDLANPSSIHIDQCKQPFPFAKPACTVDFDKEVCARVLWEEPEVVEGGVDRNHRNFYDGMPELHICESVNRELLAHNSWAQNTLNFVSMPSARKTLEEVSYAGVNTLASNLIKVVGDREVSPEERVAEEPSWKTRLAEISMGLGEAGMISYLVYLGKTTLEEISKELGKPGINPDDRAAAFKAIGITIGVFALSILSPVFMSLLAKDEMEESGDKRLNELTEELVPLVRQLDSEELTRKEKIALIVPYKEQIEEFQALQQKERQAEGLFPKQREWEELHDNKTNKIGAAAYQVLRSVAGCFMPIVGIQSAFSTAHLLSSRAITALTGEEQLGRWALPVATTVLAALAQMYTWS